MATQLSILFFEDYFVCSMLLESGEVKPLKFNGADKVPLYFYPTPEGVRIDLFAKERYEASDINAIGDFYIAIINNFTVTYRGLERKLLDFLEEPISELKKSYKELIKQSYDLDVPINICFIPGIDVVAQSFIKETFGKVGFCVSEVNYIDGMVEGLLYKSIISSKADVVLLDTHFNDIILNYIELDNKIVKKNTAEKIIGKGVDSRIGTLANLIVEKVAKKSFSNFLNDSHALSLEAAKLLPLATKEIGNFEHNELNLKSVELSDYSKATVRIDLREVEQRSQDSFKLVTYEFEKFVNKYSNFARIDRLVFVGNVLSTESYKNLFSQYGANRISYLTDEYLEVITKGICGVSERSKKEKSVPKKEQNHQESLRSGAPTLTGPPIPPVPKPKSKPQIGTPDSIPGDMPVKAPALPPLPQKKQAEIVKTPPPLPPIPVGKKADTKKEEPANTKVAIPPLPPLLNNKSGSNIKDKSENKQVRDTKSPPPLPPIPANNGKKETKGNVQAIPPLPPLPKVKK